MPRFSFNSLTGELFLPDPEGEELPNFAAARDVAEKSARETAIEANQDRRQGARLHYRHGPRRERGRGRFPQGTCSMLTLGSLCSYQLDDRAASVDSKLAPISVPNACSAFPGC